MEVSGGSVSGGSVSGGKMVLDDHEDAVNEGKPVYALQHLATFKLKSAVEIQNPKEKMKVLIELDKSGGVWPMKMYMCFSGSWLVMLDSDMREIENFPGSLITEPTAFISDDPLEVFNNILVFTVPGTSLGNTEMHFFQVVDVSAVDMVEDLKQLAHGKRVTVDRNKTPIALPKPQRYNQNGKDQYGIALAAAEVAAEKNAFEQEQTSRDIQVLNHCFEDIERFVARLQYAAEALRELELRQNEHSQYGEGLLAVRSRPPTEGEFQDILAKHKLALNFIAKLQNHFHDAAEPLHNSFISLQTVVNVCNDIYVGANITENVVNPLLRREAVAFLNHHLSDRDRELWQSLGPNWTVPKDQFRNHLGTYKPIFYDDWSPDWVVDEEAPYLAPAFKQMTTAPSPTLGCNTTWLSRLQSRNVKIAEVLYNKSAHNDKELNVVRGEYLEIIDETRNWWKARNSVGNVGYVPHSILTPLNFEVQSNYSSRDTDSVASSQWDTIHETPAELQPTQTSPRGSIGRSFNVPSVPVPPPLPPPSIPSTPSGTLKRSMAPNQSNRGAADRNGCDTEEETLMLQDTVNDELKLTLLQRERRKDLEILKTPQIFINQYSKPREVEQWLRAKGFSEEIVKKLRGLNGDELFALSPHVIEEYFGHKESRRLVSQIVLQKNICEYKTIRSSELSAKLARARQKVEQKDNEPPETF